MTDGDRIATNLTNGNEIAIPPNSNRREDGGTFNSEGNTNNQYGALDIGEIRVGDVSQTHSNGTGVDYGVTPGYDLASAAYGGG